MRKRLIWLFLSLLPMIGQAQEALPTVWQNYIEQLTEEGEDELVEDLLEIYESCREVPLNVNDTMGGLTRLPFIDNFQQDCLKAYIALYGQLVSLEELYAVAGFDSTIVELLRPLAYVGKVATPQKLTLKDILTHGRSNLVMGVSGTIEQARGYRDSIYEGNNLRLMWRYYFKYQDRLQFQISGDKDPGEAFFAASQPRGFDFYGYSLMLNDMGRYVTQGLIGEKRMYVKRLVLGQYYLQFGQGLTLWTGYGSRTAYGGRIYKYSQGLRPSGAFAEYGFLQGAATTLTVRQRWNLTLFYSYVNRDATLPRGAATDSSIDWVQSIYNSGYHRTQTEVGKKNQLVEQLYGGRIELEESDFKIGLTGAVTEFDKRIVPATYVYNDNAFRGDRNCNAGLDFAYRRGRFLLFGEGAVCRNNALDSAQSNISPAAIVGAEFVMNNSHRLSSQARYYSPTYHSLHASSLGQNGYPQNEIGAALYYQGRLPGDIEVTASVDYFWFPHMKYLVYASSRGHEYRLDLYHPFRHVRGLTVNLKYRFKEKGKNIIPSTMVDGAYRLEQTYRHQIQGNIEYGRGPWRWVTRIAYANYRGDETEANGGWLLYEDIQFRPQRIPLTLTARLALFDVDDYEARLFAVESDFVYQYSSAVYQNEGCRFYLLLRYDISQYWNVGFKYGITAYSDQETFGSGYDLINANHRQQWRIQVRLKW